ncbi:MAG: IclR family transcriptional regulator C-terminal domain-containing protein [Oscillospiraceae bacterium]
MRVGKALLAEMDDKKIEEVFSATEVVSVTPNTITEFDKLMEQIQIVRDLDYAVDNEENENGVICVASSSYKPFW